MQIRKILQIGIVCACFLTVGMGTASTNEWKKETTYDAQYIRTNWFGGSASEYDPD